MESESAGGLESGGVFYVVTNSPAFPSTRVVDTEDGEQKRPADFFTDQVRLTSMSAESITYETIRDRTFESFLKLITSRSVNFARSVSGKLGPGTKWESMLENPTQPILDYLNKTSSITDYTKIQGPSADTAIPGLDKMDPGKDPLEARAKRLSSLVRLLDDPGVIRKQNAATEEFLNSIYNSPVLVFSADLQSAVDSTLRWIRQYCQIPDVVTDYLLFDDILQNPKFRVLFVEACAESILIANKRQGISSSAIRIRDHTMSYTMAIKRLMPYRYEGLARQDSEKLLQEIQFLKETWTKK